MQRPKINVGCKNLVISLFCQYRYFPSIMLIWNQDVRSFLLCFSAKTTPPSGKNILTDIGFTIHNKDNSANSISMPHHLVTTMGATRGLLCIDVNEPLFCIWKKKIIGYMNHYEHLLFQLSYRKFVNLSCIIRSK